MSVAPAVPTAPGAWEGRREQTFTFRSGNPPIRRVRTFTQAGSDAKKHVYGERCLTFLGWLRVVEAFV